MLSKLAKHDNDEEGERIVAQIRRAQAVNLTKAQAGSSSGAKLRGKSSSKKGVGVGIPQEASSFKDFLTQYSMDSQRILVPGSLEPVRVIEGKEVGYEGFWVRLADEVQKLKMVEETLMNLKSLGELYPIRFRAKKGLGEGRLLCCVELPPDPEPEEAEGEEPKPSTSAACQSKCCIYRARATELHVGSDTVVVDLLDTGEKISVPFESVYRMPQSLKDLPPLAVLCRLPVQAKPSFNGDFEKKTLMTINKLGYGSMRVHTLTLGVERMLHDVDILLHHEHYSLCEALLDIDVAEFCCNFITKTRVEAEFVSKLTVFEGIPRVLEESAGWKQLMATNKSGCVWDWQKYRRALRLTLDSILDVDPRPLLTSLEFYTTRSIMTKIPSQSLPIRIISTYIMDEESVIIIFSLPDCPSVKKEAELVQNQLSRYCYHVRETELDNEELKNYPFLVSVFIGCKTRTTSTGEGAYVAPSYCLMHRCFFRQESGILFCVDCFWVTQDLNGLIIHRLPPDFYEVPPLGLGLRVAVPPYADMSMIEQWEEEMFQEGGTRMIDIQCDSNDSHHMMDGIRMYVATTDGAPVEVNGNQETPDAEGCCPEETTG